MAKLQITGREIETEATATLQASPRSAFRARYSPGDLNGAIYAAARYAMRDSRPTFVYGGNSYGSFCWRVTADINEALCPINNSSGRVFEVAADRTLARLLLGNPA